MHIKNIKYLLARYTFFSHVNDDMLNLIVECSTKTSVAKGCYVFNRGDLAQGLYILLAGQIKLGVISPQENEKIFSVITPGESFGETGLFLERKLPFYAQAVVDSEVLIVPSYLIKSLLDANTNIAHKMQDKLSVNLHQLIQNIEMLTFNTAPQRFINYLLEMNANAAVAGFIILPVKKVIIASILNITPETLSRIITKLHKSGIIRADGDRITINDFVKLGQFASEN
jgi:CRP-like cAMP-binding protein